MLLAKGNEDPWIAGKIKDDIEEFGYGGALVCIKKNQQLLMIAKRGNAPTIPMTVPLEFPSLTEEWKMQSRRIWGVKVTRDHPIYPCVFEWATTQMTRYTHTWEIWERQQFNLLRCSKSSKNIAQFGDKILYKPLKLSGHLRANMEDTFLFASTTTPLRLFEPQRTSTETQHRPC